MGEFILEYMLRRSPRNSIGFMIDDDGLRVTAPKRCSIDDIENAIRAKQNWILSKLDDRRQRRLLLRAAEEGEHDRGPILFHLDRRRIYIERPRFP